MVGNNYAMFVNYAKQLDGFVVGQKEDVPYDITELMNGYCKAKDDNDDRKMNQYISALFVRYWHVVVMLYQQSVSTRLDFEDIISWVYEAFEKAALYRSWLDTSKEVSKNPKGAEKCINQCITSVRQYWYKHFNQDKRRINFITSSLDEYLPCSGDDDTPMTIQDTVEDSGENDLIEEGREIIQNYLDSGDIFEAVVLDGILYQDCFIESTFVEVVGQDEEGKNIEVTRFNSEFSIIKLKKYLRNIDETAINVFLKHYRVGVNSLKAVVDEIKLLSKAQLSSKVEKVFASFKLNKEILDWLCL